MFILFKWNGKKYRSFDIWCILKWDGIINKVKFWVLNAKNFRILNGNALRAAMVMFLFIALSHQKQLFKWSNSRGLNNNFKYNCLTYKFQQFIIVLSVRRKVEKRFVSFKFIWI